MTSTVRYLLGSLVVFAFFFAQAASASSSDIKQFDFGFSHRCAVTHGGAVQCSGYNNFGQIGNGEVSETVNRPTQAIDHGATAVSAGELFTCAVVNGAVLCWGTNSSSEIGIGKISDQVPRPRKIIDHGATAVSAGGHHACAIVSGRLLCWGDNNNHQVSSDEQSFQVLTPREIFPAGVTAVSAGQGHTCAIVNAALFCWGANAHGKLGIGAASHRQATPKQVIAGGVTAVSAGAQHTCAVVGGALQCWGDNSHGQLGLGTVGGAFTAPQTVIASGVTAVSVGAQNSCAIVNGALQCWGDNAFGQLGINTSTTPVPKPTQVIARGVTAVAIGSLYAKGPVTCAMVDGTLLCARNHGFDGVDTPFGISGEESRIGVWKGTIGDLKIIACFDRSFDSGYYYLRHFRDIPLFDLDKQKLTWGEGSQEQQTGTWRLKPVGEERLEGEWSDAKGARRLPIVLTRLYSDKDGKGGCMLEGTQSIAFNAPRVGAQKIIKERVKFNNNEYLKLSTLAGAIQGIELPDNDPRYVPVNKMLGKQFQAEVQAYFECQRSTPDRPVPDYQAEIRILFWNKNWLSIEESTNGDCGGAHPFNGSGYRNIDLVRGQEVNLWTWFKHARKDSAMADLDYSYVNYVAPESLNKLILSHLASPRSRDDECWQVLEENREYQLSLGQTGIVFSTAFPHVVQACNESVQIPYPELLPFMNDKGREGAGLATGSLWH
jgi:alpha-tubulin suppressor-like RCC1 family protein